MQAASGSGLQQAADRAGGGHLLVIGIGLVIGLDLIEVIKIIDHQAAAIAQRDAQAAVLAAPYRRVAGLLATLTRVHTDRVRLDALRVTSTGAVLDARAGSYRAAARWLAAMAREQRGWRIDMETLKPASDTPVSTVGMPFRFSVQLRWHDTMPSRTAAGGGA